MKYTKMMMMEMKIFGAVELVEGGLKHHAKIFHVYSLIVGLSLFTIKGNDRLVCKGL